MKIAIIGLPGSGKTTLAGKLAAHFNLRHIEADFYYWQDGREASPQELRDRLAVALAQQDWVVDGQIGKLAPLLEGQLSAVIWLRTWEPLAVARMTRRELLRAPSSPRMAVKKFLFNIRNWQRLRQTQSELVARLGLSAPVIKWSCDQKGIRTLELRQRGIQRTEGIDEPLCRGRP